MARFHRFTLSRRINLRRCCRQVRLGRFGFRFLTDVGDGQRFAVAVGPIVIRCEPFVADVGVGKLDVVVADRVVKENLDLHFGVIDHRVRLFPHRDAQHQIGFRIRVGRFGCRHLADAKH